MVCIWRHTGRMPDSGGGARPRRPGTAERERAHTVARGICDSGLTTGSTSGGIYRHKSCIVSVPKHARVWPDMEIVRDENKNELKNLQQPCAYPAYQVATGGDTSTGADAGRRPIASPETNGYVSWVYQWVPSGFGGWTELETEVEVPGTPNDQNASIAWWSGVSPVPVSANVVLQPEIIWGNFAYNSPFGSGGNYQMLVGAQFNNQGANQGWYVCGGGGSDTGVVGNDSSEGGCGLTQVNTSDTVEFLVELFDVTSGCGDELTVSGIQYVCGDWAWYLLAAEDLNQGSGTEQDFLVGQVYTSGADAPPNGGIFPLALPAVYESYSDTSCESGAGFGVQALEASNSSSYFNSITYSPTTSVGPGNIASCNDGAAVGDFTALW